MTLGTQSALNRVCLLIAENEPKSSKRQVRCQEIVRPIARARPPATNKCGTAGALCGLRQVVA